MFLRELQLAHLVPILRKKTLLTLTPRIPFPISTKEYTNPLNSPSDLSAIQGMTFDLVVTLCDRAKKECPYLPGARRLLHRSFIDPAQAQGNQEEQIEKFRWVRDAIKDFVQELMESHFKQAE